MYRRLTFTISILLLLSFVGSASASLVAQWKLDDGSGTTAKDSVGTADGTLLNGPVWVTGKVGGALQFDGTNDSVDVGTNAIFNPTDSISITLWANIGAWGTEWAHSPIGNQEDGTGWCLRRFGAWNTALWPGIPTNGLSFTTRGVGVASNGQEDFPSNEVPPLNEWVHIACVYDSVNHMKYIYFNGKDEGKAATSGSRITAATTKTYLGAISNPGNTGTTNEFTGMLDDVRIYNHPLSAADVMAIFGGTDNPTASSPNPADKATDVLRETALSWRPGPFAGTHNVYFGANFDDVNNASIGSPLVVSKGQDANTFQPPARLSLGQTYYWRVDEVNAPPTSSTVFKGKTWSFTVEPFSIPVKKIIATASSQSLTTTGPENTINGSGLDASELLHSTSTTAMWLTAKGAATPASIQYEFDRVYKLHQMWVWNHNSGSETALGFGLKNVTIQYSTDGTNFTKLGDFDLRKAPGTVNYAHSDEVPFGGIAARYVKITVNTGWGTRGQYGLSEVRFFYIPTFARDPQPISGATGIRPDVALSWRPGREAASHKVYLGTDPNALSQIGSADSASYAPSGLNLSATYYWRIDEVNTTEAPSFWTGDVWSFSVADSVVVDDMESYTDTDGNRIYQFWADGYGTTTNGALVGYDQSANGTFGETTIMHGGKQSMPFRYGQNTATTSEAKRTFDTAQDWTAAGIKTLTLYFYGDPANAAVQLYVTINSTKVLYTGPADNVQRARWNQMNVDLSAIAASTLRSVKTLTIGVSGTGKGTLYFDDIRLYKAAPAVPVAVNPGTTGLVAWYAFTNNVTDGSGKGNNGTLVGAPSYMPGLAGYGTAMQFNGTADAVNLGASKPAFNPAGSLSVSLWANIGAWSTAWGHVMISNRGESNVGWQLRRYSSTMFCFTTRGTGNEDTPTTVAPPLNQWVHIGCVFDSVANTKTIYLNGVQNAQVTTTAGSKIAATTFNTYIGGRDVGTNTLDTAAGILFTGLLDEIRVYDRALSAGEVDFLSDPNP